MGAGTGIAIAGWILAYAILSLGITLWPGLVSAHQERQQSRIMVMVLVCIMLSPVVDWLSLVGQLIIGKG